VITFEVNTEVDEYIESSLHMVGGDASAITDANGYWYKELIRSSEFETLRTYKFKYGVTDSWERDKISGSEIILTVPDADNSNITGNLTQAA
jgi:hypothetical protein